MSARLERLRRRAADHLAAGQATPAAATLEAVLAAAPDDDAARLQLGLARLHQGRYRDARGLVLEACVRRRDDPDLVLPRLEALRAFAEHAQMRALQAEVDALGRLDARRLTLVAATLALVGATGEAQRWVDAAVTRDPHDLLARTNRAMIALDAGRLEEAERELEAVAAAAPLVPAAHWLLAGVRTQTPARNHVDRLEGLAARPDLSDEDRIPLAFARHKELDDLGRHAEAWAALEEGCRRKRATLHHDPQRQDDLLDELLRAFDATLAEPSRSAGTATPVFIVGMHRSGTSLLERMLEAHPAIAAGGESARWQAQLAWATDHRSGEAVDETLIARVPGIDFAAVGARYLEAHAWLSDGHSHFTEKLPENFLWLGAIRRALPQARVLWLRRDPLATCWSNLRELFAGRDVAHSYDQHELARACARERRARAHWAARLQGFVCEVRYESLVEAPEAELRRVLAFCGLPWHAACLAPERAGGTVRTASAAQVRQPVHRRSLGRWRPYADALAPLREALLRLGVD